MSKNYLFQFFTIQIDPIHLTGTAINKFTFRAYIPSGPTGTLCFIIYRAVPAIIVQTPLIFPTGDHRHEAFNPFQI
jgi:hypothetical protein